MSELSQDQIEKRDAIRKGATITGAIVGVIAGLLAYWLLGSMGGAVRLIGGLIVAVGVGYLVYGASFKSKAKSAACEKCGAAFSRTRTDHSETLVASTPKVEREEQEDGSTKVTSWTEDKFDMHETYTCGKCGDETTRTYDTTRRRDEKTVVEPAVTPKGASGGKGAASGAQTATAQKGSSKGGAASGGKGANG